MDIKMEPVEGGRHACGKCFTSFSTPEAQHNHYLTCFGDSRSNVDVPAEDEPMEHHNPVQNNFSITIEEDENEGHGNVGPHSHPAFDPTLAKNNEPGGRCIQIVAGKKIMQCTTCFKTFTNYNSFKRHRRMHVSGAAHSCNICGKNFYRRYLWRNHMERNHCGAMENSNSPKSESPSKSSLSNDVGTYEVNFPKRFPCYTCEIIFDSRMKLSAHRTKVHSLSQSAFPVSYGDSMEISLDENANSQQINFNTEGIVRDGSPDLKSKADSSSARSSPSSFCDLKETSENSLDQFLIPCNICEVNFDNEESFHSHMKQHSASTGSPEPLNIEEDRELSGLDDGVVVVHPEPVSDDSEETNGNVDDDLKIDDWSCYICCTHLKDKTMFMDHMKMHLHLLCEYCGQYFSNAEVITKHQQVSNCVNKRACHTCSMPFKTAEELKNHVILHRQNFSPFKANILSTKLMGRNSNSTKRVDNLLRNKGLMPSGSCIVDDYGSEVSFTKTVVPSSGMHSTISVTLKPLEKPRMSEMPQSLKGGNCYKCGKNFKRQELLQRHMIRDCEAGRSSKHQPPLDISKNSIKSSKRSNEPPLVDIFPSKKVIQDNRNVNSGSTNSSTESKFKISLLQNKGKVPFKCTHCPKSFPALGYLNQHLSEHFPHFLCHFCGMPFQDKMNMFRHLKGVHGRAQRYYCYACCSNVGNETELKKHISVCRGPPTAEEPSPQTSISFGNYKECQTCHKKFANEKRLMNHSCVGSNEGLWTCEVCNISFPQSAHLASHQQQAHKSDEIYRCDVCGMTGNKEFTITHLITVHMTRVSPANHCHTPIQQSALTITSQSPSKSRFSPVGEATYLAPKNPNGQQSSHNFKQPTSSPSKQTLPDKKPFCPSGFEYCMVCDNFIQITDFPDHMLRKHCSAPKLLNNDLSSAGKERTNVIEIITKDSSNSGSTIQVVR